MYIQYTVYTCPRGLYEHLFFTRTTTTMTHTAKKKMHTHNLKGCFCMRPQVCIYMRSLELFFVRGFFFFHFNVYMNFVCTVKVCTGLLQCVAGTHIHSNIKLHKFLTFVVVLSVYVGRVIIVMMPRGAQIRVLISVGKILYYVAAQKLTLLYIWH